MAKKKEYPGILFYKDEMELMIESCSYEQIGFLFERIYRFGFEGKEAENMPAELKFAWDFMKRRQLEDRANYDRRCIKNAENGQKSAEKARERRQEPRAPKLTVFDDDDDDDEYEVNSEALD